MQAAFVAEEWVDHALGQAHEVEGKLGAAKRAHEETDKNLKETLSQLIEIDKSKKNAEVTLANYEKQAVESLKAQKKAENQLALTMVKVKPQQKQLEVKDAEKAKAEQAAYDAGMTKTTQSLTA